MKKISKHPIIEEVVRQEDKNVMDHIDRQIVRILQKNAREKEKIGMDSLENYYKNITRCVKY